MEQSVNRRYAPLFKEHPRYFFLMGGRGGGRSTVASQYAVANLTASGYFRCAIMRYILGDIRNSIYREITDRATETGIFDALDVNDSTMTIKYGLNSINAVGFKKSSGDQTAKLKSLANYNCVIIEEADEIPEEDFMQLDDSLRTLKGDIAIIFLLNPPPRDHWIINRWFDISDSEAPGFYIPKLKPDIKNAIFIWTSYKDNRSNLSVQTIENYEAYRLSKPAHYWTMVRGYVPEVVQGRIYGNWAEIDAIPHEARLERYGLDFGYSNDPSSLVAVYRYNGGFILDQMLYQKGMSNKQIADTLKNLPRALVIADSAEPKSIDEIKGYGINIVGAEKGKDSVNNGIQLVQDQRISVTRRSTDILREYKHYAWIMDKEGNSVNEPNHAFSHSMDAIRYALVSMLKTVGSIPRPTTGLVKPYPGMAA
jgi:phage terminase large subunit